MEEDEEGGDGCEVQCLAMVSEDGLRATEVRYCEHGASVALLGEDLSPGFAMSIGRAWVMREIMGIPSELIPEAERLIEGHAHRN